MKRQRVDSITAAARIVAGAAREVAPPAHILLTDADWPYWHSVVSEFAKSEWTDHQLEIAAQLAKAMADLESEMNKLRVEGYVGDDKRANPRGGVTRDLRNSIMSLRRNLSLHARAREGEARDVAKRRDMTKDIEGAAGASDSLLN